LTSFFFLFISSIHCHTSNQPPLFCVCTSAFIVQCSTPIQPSIRTFQNGTRGPSPLCLTVSLSQSSVVSFACCLCVVVDSILLFFYFFNSLPHVHQTKNVQCSKMHLHSIKLGAVPHGKMLLFLHLTLLEL
jgi:hypothetical protein